MCHSTWMNFSEVIGPYVFLWENFIPNVACCRTFGELERENRWEKDVWKIEKLVREPTWNSLENKAI